MMSRQVSQMNGGGERNSSTKLTIVCILNGYSVPSALNSSHHIFNVS